MSDAKDRTGEAWGPYRLDERLKSTGPGGDCLYLAHHRRTGVRTLVLLPVAGVPVRGSWRVRMSGRKEADAVTLAVERPSRPLPLDELSEVLGQMTTEVLRVEDQSRLTAYLLAGPVKGVRSSRWRLALGVLGLLAVGAGLWLSQHLGW